MPTAAVPARVTCIWERGSGSCWTIGSTSASCTQPHRGAGGEVRGCACRGCVRESDLHREQRSETGTNMLEHWRELQREHTTVLLIWLRAAPRAAAPIFQKFWKHRSASARHWRHRQCKHRRASQEVLVPWAG